jgi:8-oxo-dGTP pyrophosphatase MutT (NUDIX family)
MKIVKYISAGGVVIHEDHLLLLDRPARGEVRLPKGHIEAGETPGMAAVRETVEETGYRDLEIVADLGSQVVEFDYQGKHYVRTEHYFLMRLQSQQQVPRNEEDAADFTVIWKPLAQAVELLTFAAERNVARKAIAAHSV